MDNHLLLFFFYGIPYIYTHVGLFRELSHYINYLPRYVACQRTPSCHLIPLEHHQQPALHTTVTRDEYFSAQHQNIVKNL